MDESGQDDDLAFSTTILRELFNGVGMPSEILDVANHPSIIAIGGRTVIYSIEPKYSSLDLTAETVLQFIASVNKFLDVVAVASFAALANAVNDIRLANSRFDGIALRDLDVKEALCSPLQAIRDGYHRYKCRRQARITKTTGLMFVFTLATAICVWLLPVSNNTLLIPKPIYHPLLHSDGYPSSTPTFMYAPRVVIENIDWNNTISERATGLAANAISDGHLASLIFAGLLDLSEEPYAPGWNKAKHFPEKYITAYKRKDSHTVVGASLRAVDIQQVFAASHKFGPSYAKLSIHTWADVNITTPSITTRCNSSASMPSANPRVNMSALQDEFSLKRIISVHLDEVANLNFSAVMCNISLEQSLFPIGSWQLEDSDTPQPGVTIWINADTKDMYPIPQPTDDLLAQSLQQMLENTLPELETISSIAYPFGLQEPSPFLHFLITRARLMQARQAQRNDSDDFVPHIASLLTFWAQHSLTLANWNLSTSPTELTYHNRLHYMVYASGPRQRYQYAILLVPCWLLAAVVAALGFCIWYGFESRPEKTPDMWTLADMLVVANRAPNMGPIASAEGGTSVRHGIREMIRGMGVTRRAGQTRLYLREDGDGQQVLTNDTYFPLANGAYQGLSVNRIP